MKLRHWLGQQTRAASIRREAAALQRAADLETTLARREGQLVEMGGEVARVRGTLADLVRAVDTAPEARTINMADPSTTSSGRFYTNPETGECRVRAPHLDYRPLADAMAAAHAELAQKRVISDAMERGRQRGSRACGAIHDGPCGVAQPSAISGAGCAR